MKGGEVGTGWHCHLPDEIPPGVELSPQIQESKITLILSPSAASLFVSLPPSLSLCPKLGMSGVPDSHLALGSHNHLCSSAPQWCQDYHVVQRVPRVKEQADFGVKQTRALVTTLPQVTSHLGSRACAQVSSSVRGESHFPRWWL